MAGQDDTGKKTRPAVIAGNGETTFVDLHDLKPINPVVATLSGAAAGGAVGGISAFGLASVSDYETYTTGRIFPKHGFLITVISTAIGTVLGGVVGYLKAKTHNDWSAKIVKSTLEKPQSQALL